MSLAEMENKKEGLPKLIRYSLLLGGVQGIAFIIFISFEKSIENSVFLGLSLSRLVMVAVIATVSLLMFWAGSRSGDRSKPVASAGKWIEQNTNLVVFFLTWIAALLLLFQVKSYFNLLVEPLGTLDSSLFYQRLRPFLIWSGLVFSELGFSIFFTYKETFTKLSDDNQIMLSAFYLKLEMLVGQKHKFHFGSWLKSFWKRNKWILWIWLGLLMLWLGIAMTKIGILPDVWFWNPAGVPLLPQQIVFVLLLLLFLLDAKCVLKGVAGGKILKLTEKPGFPYAVMILICLAAVIVWNGQELKHTYFAPSPYPPNYERYPFSDARWFDIGGQYFLLGQGLNNGNLTDRPFMMLLTALLHLIAGQQYDRVVLIQILFLAWIPAFLFLLGWKLHSKTAGLGIALLVVIKEKNAIASANQAGIINVKILMSELPNALLLVILALCTIYWLKSARKNNLWPVIAGGVLGLAVGIRGTSLAIFPLIIFTTLLGLMQQQNWLKKWLTTNLLFSLAFVFVLLPYSIETYHKYGSPFWLYKITNTVERYNESSHMRAGSSKLYKFALARSDLPAPNKNSPSRPGLTDVFPQEGIALPENPLTLSLRHFVHNEIMTIFIYPLSYEVVTIDGMVAKPFWNSQTFWTGDLKPGEVFFLGLNLLLLAAGIGYALQRWQIAGAVPLIIHLGYNLSNALARTSGGRYVVPTDWVLHVYILLGFLVIVYQLRNWNAAHPSGAALLAYERATPRLVLGTLLFFLLLASSYLFSGIFRPRFDLAVGELEFSQLDKAAQQALVDVGISGNQIDEILQSEGGYFKIGLVLYPQYFRIGENEEESSYIPSMPDDQPRLYFVLLTNEGPRHINLILGEQKAPAFPNAGYGYVVGCDRTEFIEAKAFVPVNAPESHVVTTPLVELTCDEPSN